MLAILPGVALALWWRGRALLKSQWALLGVLALTIGCANLLVQIPRTEFSVGQFARDGMALHDGQYPGGAAYLDALGSASVSMWRLAVGEMPVPPPSTISYTSQPPGRWRSWRSSAHWC